MGAAIIGPGCRELSPTGASTATRSYHKHMAYSKIFAIREGDFMVTFQGFACIPGNTIVAIQGDGAGLYFQCSEGKHYLQRQVDSEGYCLGLTALI